MFKPMKVARIGGLLLLIALVAGQGSPVAAGQDEWTPAGGPPGLVYAVALDPVTPALIYAGTSTAGVYKSINGGRTWTSVGQGLGTNAVLSLAIDPSRPSTIYAGTNRGVYRSEDGAVTWAEASEGVARDPFGNSYVYTLVLDPGQPSTVYAGTLLGVYKSQDGGRTWKGKNTGLRVGIAPSVEAMAIDPVNTGILYAGAGYQGLSGTVFKTENGGETWVPLSVGLTQSLVSAISVDRADHQRVYVATRGQGVFVSRDGGRTWQTAGSETLESGIAAITVGSNPPAVYAAGTRNGFYRSDDAGNTWERADGSIGNRGPTSLAVDPLSNSNIWLTSSGGLYLSNDRGSTWTEAAQGLAASQIVNAVTHPAHPNIVYVSAWASGIYITSDGGASWHAAPLGVGIASSLAVDPLDPSIAYAGMVYISGIKDTGLYLSHDAGVTWGLVPEFKGSVVSAMASSPGRVFVGSSSGVYISEDSGTTWRQSNTGLPITGQIRDIAVQPGDPTHLYLTLESAPQDLYWSKDTGGTWARLRSFDEYLWAMSPSPVDPQLIYAATNTTVFSSSDGGATWTEMPFSGRGTVLTLMAHPLAARTLYLGSSQGAYRSVDGGRTWTSLGLRDEAVTALAISPADTTHLYGGTFGKGVWTYNAVPSLSIRPRSLTFLVEPGGNSLAPVPISISDESGGSFAWTIQAPSWLSVTPLAGSSLPVTVTASVNPGGLSAGSYENALTIESAITNTRNSPLSVPATLHFGPISRQFLPDINQGASAW